MKRFYKIALSLTASVMLASCSEYNALDFQVDQPDKLVAQELIDAYDPLKTYLDSTKYPSFKLGAGVSLSDYVNKGVMHRLVNNNFDEITLGYEMKHGAVVSEDGSLNLANVENLLETASNAGISVFGHTLAWHANQNATYLNGLIAPIVIPSAGGPTWDLVIGANFETDNAPNYEYNSNADASFTSMGEGFDGVGRALKIANSSVRPNDWEVQLFLKFAPAVVAGEQYELKMDVKADVSVTYPTQAHIVPGSYKHWDFFGAITAGPTWTTYTKQITVSPEMEASGSIAFNLGANATNYYFDNITLKKYNPLGGATTIERTFEEKKELINDAFEYWISGMVDTSKKYVKAWDVVNEPMDDGNPYELKTGIGKTLKADEFYWQDYLGKDYAVKAFQLARQHGNPTDIHFINDYNLEYSLDKCRGLIEYVEYIESKGAKVDGIGTQMHISTTSDKEKIDEMFKLLAATGKLIKVSELDIGIDGKKTAQATEDDYKLQADLYKYVIDKYFEIIPVNQQYGITIWSPLDSPANSSWRAGEPIGLWTESNIRKPAYVGVAESLKDK